MDAAVRAGEARLRDAQNRQHGVPTHPGAGSVSISQEAMIAALRWVRGRTLGTQR